MLREVLITVYLLVFKIFFQINKLFPLQNKTVFVTSFPGNNPLIIEKLIEQSLDEKIIVIQENNKSIEIPKSNNIKRLILHHPIQFFRSIYHLATARIIFVDNYFGFLAVSDFKEEVKCIQVWHAVGAFKLFGLNDLTNNDRKPRALRRFQTVYNRFDAVVVGSHKMEQIFKESFGIENDHRFLRTGIPRTDFFFDDIKKRHALQQFKKDFPFIQNKKVILYAPTYREEQLSETDIKLSLDLAQLNEQLSSTHLLLLRLHPALSNHFSNEYPNFVIDVSNYDSIDTLLVGSDILISDYSSIPFEFAILNKPMIFYVPDLERYAETRGLISNYENEVPGPIVKTTNKLIEAIQQEQFDLNVVNQFAKEWNEFSNGQSTLNLIQALYAFPEEKREQIQENV